MWFSKANRSIAALFLLSGLALGEWPMFGHDPSRRGYSEEVEFSSNRFKLQWIFSLREHTWKYAPGTSVWSSQAVVAKIEDRSLVFVGAYDHNLYAIDALTGKEVWRFTAGGLLNFSPCLGRIKDKNFVFVASGDRTVYALDAANGQRIWSYEVYPWKYTVEKRYFISPSSAVSPSSPVFVKINGRGLLYVGVWINDKLAFRTVQRGELFCLDAETGRKIWSKVLAGPFLNSPGFTLHNNISRLLLSCHDGRIFCLHAEKGEILWTKYLSHKIYASVSLDDDKCFVGDHWGMVYCLSVKDGNIIWYKKLGDLINSTISTAEVKGRKTLFVGSDDRCFYALEAGSGKLLWRFRTGKHITSSAAVAKVEGKVCVFFSSLDDNLYVLEAEKGRKIWNYQTGGMLWPYERKGGCLWSSPSVSIVKNRPYLFFPAYDGKLYAFAAE